MKKLLIFCLILGCFAHGKAQENVQRLDGYHQHKGFYFNMNAGPVFGNVINKDNPYGYNSPTINYNGTGTLLDLKVGVAIYENIILHATIISNSLTGPTATTTLSPSDFNPSIHKMPDNFSINESMLGGGFTKYVMPANVFLSATMGVGCFSTRDTNNSKNNISTDPGFSFQVKVGREWWIAKNWCLGLGFSYGKTKLRNISSIGEVEQLNSNRIGISLNTTFN